MRPKPFALERYFAKYEFSAEILISSSDCESIAQSELLSWADPEAQALWQNLWLGYTESAGLPLLRQEIARLYRGVHADEVLECAPQEGILIAMNCLLEAGDHVIATFPGYQSLYEIARALGCEVTLWEPNEDRGWRFDPEFVRASLKPNTKLIVANFPHNPTGYLPPRADFDRLIAVAREAGVYLFSDEMYRYLEREPGERLPSACELYDRAVTLSGLSKSFGLPGTRVGWLVTRDRQAGEAFAAFKDYTTICASAPSEILALIGLRNRERLVARNLDIVQRNVALVEEFFAAHEGLFTWTPPRAGSIGFPRFHGNVGSLELCERLVQETGVMLLPSTVYDYDARHVRLGLGRANFADGLARLDGWLARVRDWLR